MIVCVCGLLASTASAAPAPFDFSVDRLEVIGPNPFLDEFDDGQLDVPPTSALIIAYAGSVISESGGFLQLTDADGAELVEPPGQPSGSRDLVALGPYPGIAIQDGQGSARIEVTLQPGGLPSVSADEYTRYLDLGVQFEGVPQLLGAQLFLLAGGFRPEVGFTQCQDPGPQVVLVTNHSLAVHGFTLALYGCDPIDPGAVTGPIVLRLEFDDDAETLTAAYSIDGGSSFVDFSAWDFTTAPVALGTPGSLYYGFPLLGAGAAAVTGVPGPGWLLAPALAAVALRLRRLRTVTARP